MQTRIVEILRNRLEGCRKVAILGIGSGLRGDDAAGLLVIRGIRSLLKLTPLHWLDVLGVEGANAPENVTGRIKKHQPEHIIVVDAADMGVSVGVCREIARDEISETHFSTHTLPLKVVIDYLEQSTGAGITILGIQPGCLDFGVEPGSALRDGVGALSSGLYNALNACDRILAGVAVSVVSDERRSRADTG